MGAASELRDEEREALRGRESHPKAAKTVARAVLYWGKHGPPAVPASPFRTQDWYFN